MPLKTVEIEGKTYAEVEDGKPVYTKADGSEAAYDAESMADRIGVINRENGEHKKAIKEAETKLKAYADIEDVQAAKDALETVANLSDKKLVEAGQVDEIKQAAIQATEAKYKPAIEELQGKNTELEGQLHDEMIGSKFASSGFIKDKMTVPPEMVRNSFISHFTIEDGKVLAKDFSGTVINSKSNPGEPAGFEEALEHIVNSAPYRDNILRGDGKSGTGAGGSRETTQTGNGNGAKKEIKREEWNTMDHLQKQEVMQAGDTVVVD